MSNKNKGLYFKIGIILLGTIVTTLNQSIINIALPSIMKQLNIDATTAQWLSTGYTLVSGILVPISAYLIQRFSYRHLFIVSMILFTAGSFVCAISPDFSLLLVGRILQAVGSGIVMPLTMNIFMFTFPPEKRGSAMGILGLGLILAPAMGPTVCGYVIEHHNWNVMFYAMAIIAAVVLIVGIIFLDIKNKRGNDKLDILGTILSTLGFGSLLYGISEIGDKGWGNHEVIAFIAASVVLLAVFVIYSLKRKNPLLEMRVFTDFYFSYTLIVNLVLNVALYGGMLLLPIYLQMIHGYTPLEAGLLLLPGSLVMGIMGVFTGKLFDRFGIRPLAVFGIAIMTIATYMFSKLNLNTSYGHIMFFYTLRSFGMSFVMMPMSTAGLMTIKPNLIPHATALQNTLKQIAASVGTAILVVIMSDQSKDYIKNLGTSIQPNSVTLATIHGINSAFLVATLISGVSWCLSLFLRRASIAKTIPVIPETQS
jgi:drug resistance transporter, EmrB/QacA subfamily